MIYAAKEEVSKQGNPMYVIDYKITEGPAGLGRKLRSWYAITPKALFKIVELNKAVGFAYPNKETPAGEFEFPDADEYLGLDVNVKLSIDEYPGVDEDGNDAQLTRNQVDRVSVYDSDKITTEDELEGADAADDGGVYL